MPFPPILNVHLEIANPTDLPQTIFLEKGRCFEILDPTAGMQNAALAENTEVAIPPMSEIQVDLPAFCLNRYRHMTHSRNLATITPFIFTHNCNDQVQIWQTMACPAA